MSKASPILIASFGLTIANGIVAQDVEKKKDEAIISGKIENLQAKAPKETATQPIEDLEEVASEIIDEPHEQVSEATEDLENTELPKVPAIETSSEPTPATVGNEAPSYQANDEFKLEENDDVQVPASPLPEKNAVSVEEEEQSVLPRVNAEGNNTITGTIFDAESGRGLPGVNISLPELDLFARTNTQGNFTLEKVPAGTIKISAIKIGYFALDSTVEVSEGKKATFNKGLTAKPVETDNETHVLDDYDVVAEYVEEEEFSIDLGQTESGSLVSGITEAEFSRQAISDAGDAVEKVSGANIVDGKFAVVRGLADRYISTTFNGAAISSAEPTRKAVQLDLFPSSSIKRIDVAKTFNSSLSGDFGGAAIDIVSKNFPEEQILSFKLKYEYDSNLPSDFLIHPTQDLGFTGNLGSTPNLDNILVPDNSGSLQLPLLTNDGTQEEANDVFAAYSEFVDNRPLTPEVDDPEQELSYTFSYGDTFDIAENFKLGVLVSANQKNEDSFNESSQFRETNRSWIQRDYTRSTEWNVYLSAGAQFGELNEITASYFKKRIAEQNVSIGDDIRQPGDTPFGTLDGTINGTIPFYGAAAELTSNFIEIESISRDLEIFQLQGSHAYKENGPNLYWSYTDSNALESRPDTTFHEFTTLDFASENLFEALSGERSAVATQISNTFSSLGLGNPTFTDLDDLFQFIRDNESQVTALLPFPNAQAVIDTINNDFLTPTNPELGQIDTVALGLFGNVAGPGNVTSYSIESVEETTEDINVGLKLPFYFSEEREDQGIEFDLGYSSVDRQRQTRGTIFETVFETIGGNGEINQGFRAEELYPTLGSPTLVFDRDGNLLEFERGLGEFLVNNPVSPFFLRAVPPDGTDPFILDGSIGTGNFFGLISNNVDAQHEIKSYYLSSRLFLNDFEIIAGLRYEEETRAAQLIAPTPLSFDGTIPDIATLEETAWLPSLSISNRFFDDQLGVVAAWSRTLARPTFFEWVPTNSFDLSTGFFRNGNPDLQNSRIQNLELAFDYKPTENIQLRTSFFSKSIDDPIIDLVVPSGGDPIITFINADSGTIQGIELEGQINNLGPFSLSGNLTYINAAVDYQFDIFDPVLDSQFPFQPEWIANVNLGYENEQYDFGINLIYNFTDEFATLLPSQANGSSIIQNPQHALDLVVRKGFGDKQRLTVTAGVKNLLSTDRELSFQGGLFDGRLRNIETNERLFFIDLKAEF